MTSWFGMLPYIVLSVSVTCIYVMNSLPFMIYFLCIKQKYLLSWLKWETDFNRNLFNKFSLVKPVMGGKSSWDVYIAWIIVGAAWIRKTCGLSINTWSPVYFRPIKNKNSSLQPRCLPLGIRQHRVTCIMGSKENSSVLVCDQIITSTDVTPSVSTPWIIVDL